MTNKQIKSIAASHFLQSPFFVHVCVCVSHLISIGIVFVVSTVFVVVIKRNTKWYNATFGQHIQLHRGWRTRNNKYSEKKRDKNIMYCLTFFSYPTFLVVAVDFMALAFLLIIWSETCARTAAAMTMKISSESNATIPRLPPPHPLTSTVQMGSRNKISMIRYKYAAWTQ